MKLKCIIVEDETPAQEVLKQYIAAVSSLELAGAFFTASDAIAFLHENRADLIFLDINMPVLSGMEFLRVLPDPPAVIITTAYTDYALEGYEYNVADYLLKPIRYERFLKAVNKVIDAARTSSPLPEPAALAQFLFVREDHTVHKIDFGTLQYVQAMGNYLRIFVSGQKPIITRSTLTEIEAQLPEQQFLRIHKSYIVALAAIEKITYNQVHIAGTVIPVGTTYRQEVLKKTGLK